MSPSATLRAWHCQSPESLFQHPEGDWVFRVFVPRGVRFGKVELVLDQAGNSPWFAMKVRRLGEVDAYECRASLAPVLHTYRFRVQQEGRRSYLDAQGETPYRPAAASAFRVHPTDASPSWPREQVFYQVFPDRFRRGEDSGPLGDLSHRGHGEGGVARRWGSKPKKRQGWREFYGGDLAGVRESLDYLQDLGVSALYLNPIFEASSVHRYDTKDYRKIDDLLGGPAAYAALVQELKSRGMRFILDGVFNHTGDEIDWFDPKLKGPRGDWYTRAPNGSYMAWWAVHTLPKLDFATPGVIDEIYAGENSVVKAWLRGEHAADGWRLDVPACLGEGGAEAENLRHLRGILDAARAANPEAYVFGEHFETAGAWLDARVHDATMNYSGFTFPTCEWLAGSDYEGFDTPVDAVQLARAWRAHRAGRTADQNLVPFNLLGSHDVPRVRTRLGGDLATTALAHVLLLTFPGVPSVYYGDEVGLEGGPDPDCRRCFPWNEAGTGPRFEAGGTDELWAQVRDLMRLRREHPALIHGDLRVMVAEGYVLIFARVAGAKVVVVAVNRGPSRRRVSVELGGIGAHLSGLVDRSGGAVAVEQGRLTVELGGQRARVLT